MHVLIWIAMGAVAGLLSMVVLADNGRGGLPNTVVLGAICAVVASLFLRMLGIGSPGITLWSFVIAFLGAVTLLWACRAFVSNSEQMH